MNATRKAQRRARSQPKINLSTTVLVVLLLNDRPRFADAGFLKNRHSILHHHQSDANPVDFFRNRDHDRLHQSDRNSWGLMNLPIPSLHSDSPVSLLSVRGGFTTPNNLFHEMQSRPFKPTLSESRLFGDWNDNILPSSKNLPLFGTSIQHNNLIQLELSKVWKSSPVMDMQPPIHSPWNLKSNYRIDRTMQQYPLRRRTFVRTTATKLAFGLSQILFLSGSHIDTLWYHVKPIIAQWLSDRMIRKRAMI
jgi:hypothetical protein